MKVKINKEFFKKFLDVDKKTKVIVIVGIIGILLILASELFGNKSSDNVTETTSEINTTDEAQQYKNEIENELTQMLSQISGVGECEVMVTVEGTTEYVYAENLSKYTDTNGENTSDKYENDIVMVEKDGEKNALVKKIIKPQINGVVVVCTGGDDVKISERIIKAVSTALNLSTDRICVESKIK